MVRRIVAAKFGAGVEQATKPAAKTIYDKFCLINCLFRTENGALAASVKVYPGQTFAMVLFEARATTGRLFLRDSMKASQKVQLMEKHLLIRCISCTLLYSSSMTRSTQQSMAPFH
jgi:hypothetical protein